jgi:DNA-binding MarR family transcriptional regulator
MIAAISSPLMSGPSAPGSPARNRAISRSSPTQFAVLSRLSTAGAQTTADLARAERMRPQSMRTTLVPLEELGLIKRVPHPTDGRQSLVSLTPEGEQQVRSNRSIRESWLVHAMTERLSPSERRRLIDSVGLLSRLLD